MVAFPRSVRRVPMVSVGCSAERLLGFREAFPAMTALPSPRTCASCAPFAKQYHPLQADMVTKCLLWALPDQTCTKRCCERQRLLAERLLGFREAFPAMTALPSPRTCASCAPFAKQYHPLQAEMVTKCLLCRLLTLWRRRLLSALRGSSCAVPATDCFAPRAPSLLSPAKCASCAPFAKQYHPLQAEMVTKCLLCRLLTLWSAGPGL